MHTMGIVFPGQGTQYVGMGRDFYREFEKARTIFAEASDTLKCDVASLCFEGPQTTLDQTVNTQIAVLTVDVVAYRIFHDETDILPHVMAGHSLGEYAALTAAGALTFSDALRLVNARSRYQQEAAPDGTGSMAAVMGLKKELVEEICQNIRHANGSVVDVANFNAPSQCVISGHRGAVAHAITQLKQEGARVIELPISVPCHSRLLVSAAKQFEEDINTIDARDCTVGVIPNYDPDILYSRDNAGMLLVRQLHSPVRWQETIEKMADMGIDTIIEIGPKRTLSSLTKRITKDIRTLNVEDMDSLNKTIQTITQ